MDATNGRYKTMPRPSSVPPTGFCHRGETQMAFRDSRAAKSLLAGFVMQVGFLGMALSQVAHASAAPTLKIDVDARDLPRRLLHSRIQIPCQPGTLKLWYPKWVPGTHGPHGPVQNVGGLRIQTWDGKLLK